MAVGREAKWKLRKDTSARGVGSASSALVLDIGHFADALPLR
jgi:hypothetical protein